MSNRVRKCALSISLREERREGNGKAHGMAINVYDDRVILSLYDAETGEIDHEFEIDEFPGGASRFTILKRLVSYWCVNCECAFRKKDVQEDNPVCPVCGEKLDEFDLANIIPDLDYEGMFPNGLDDGESVD